MNCCWRVTQKRGHISSFSVYRPPSVWQMTEFFPFSLMPGGVTNGNWKIWGENEWVCELVSDIMSLRIQMKTYYWQLEMSLKTSGKAGARQRTWNLGLIDMVLNWLVWMRNIQWDHLKWQDQWSQKRCIFLEAAMLKGKKSIWVKIITGNFNVNIFCGIGGNEPKI